MTTAAFWLGLCGLVVAAIALGWQIASYLLSGVRVKVSTIGTWTILYPASGRQEDFVKVEACVVGRLAVAITSVGLLTADGQGIASVTNAHSANPTLPKTYEVGASPLQYVWSVEDLRASMVRNGKDRLVVCGTVGLGTGQSARSKDWVTILPTGDPRPATRGERPRRPWYAPWRHPWRPAQSSTEDAKSS